MNQVHCKLLVGTAELNFEETIDFDNLGQV